MIRRIKDNYKKLTLRVYNNSEKIERLNEDRQKDVEKLHQYIINEKNRNYITEKNIMKMFKALEYKYCQHNQALNKILYEQDLQYNKNKYKKDFNPLISIIIPVYNGSNYLKNAIDSALAQTYKNIEIIVVNDGSNDNGKTEAVAKKYRNKIRYYKKENGGVSTALNYGIAKMKGEYFSWLSHDDIMYENHLSEHIKFLRYFSDEKTVGYSNFDIIDENSKLKIEDTITSLLHLSDYKLSKVSHYACILQGEINGGNIIIPKIAFKECGLFEEGNKISQEKDMWFRLLKKYNLINIPITTTAIRIHSKQVSNNKEELHEKTKEKLLEIIDNISSEDKIKENGSVEKFYLALYKHYNNNSLNDLEEEMKKRIEKLTNGKK